MQRLTATYEMELEESYRIVEREIEKLEQNRDSTKGQQSQLTWTPGSSQRQNHQPMSVHRLDLRPLHICSR